MTEQYFALKYYEEIAGYVIMGVLLLGTVIFIFGSVVIEKIKEWFRK